MMLAERLRFERELATLNVQGTTQPATAKPPPFPVVSSTHRIIFIIDAPPFSRLPPKIKAAAVDEVRSLFGFIGGKATPKMKVELIEAARLPSSFAFSDAVVALVASASALQAHLTDSFRLQGQNAAASLRHHNVTFQNPFANPSRVPVKLERVGVGRGDKRVSGGRAFPFTGAYVALDEIMTEFVDEADSKIHASKVRQKRASPDLNAKYWGSRWALLDTAILSVLDNPQDPSKWLWQPELFGQLIGRAMAHEVRHTYVGAGHAAAGLGADAPRLVEAKFAKFSPTDQRAIARAIVAHERRQGRLAVVPTNPKGQPFPF